MPPEIQDFVEIAEMEETQSKMFLECNQFISVGYEVRSSATYSAVPDIYREESLLPWWTWLVALIFVMFSVFMVIMCCLRYVSPLKIKAADTFVLAILKSLGGTSPP